MASNSETGHAKNVALFNDVVTICKGFGSRYKPAPKPLELPTITAQAKDAEKQQAALNKAIAIRITAVANKDKAFEGLGKRVTRALSAFKSCTPLAGELRSAQTIAKEIKGENIRTKKANTKADAAAEVQQQAATGKGATNDRSNSRMSMDTRIENLTRLVDVFVSSGVYATNEDDITVAALSAYANQLKTLSEAVTEAEQPENEARKLRDTALYAPNTGMLDIFQAVKDYIKSAFGTGSPEYKAVTRLRFKKPRKV